MAKIGLVACVSAKLDQAERARSLYQSALFEKTRAVVERECQRWYILSAKYGLVCPDEIIDPYEETLARYKTAELKQWAERVWGCLQPRLKPGDEVVFYAGMRYRENLVPRIEQHGCRVSIPMEGLPIGKQLQWLGRRNRHAGNLLDRLYAILQNLEEGLGGKHLLQNLSARDRLPEAGLYVFFEPEEWRSNQHEQRVVRVGTHRVSTGSKSTLWGRLRQHRGSRTGTGNHRGSIFRLHLGHALAQKYPALAVPTWGQGSSAPRSIRDQETALEAEVSEVMGQMSILWIDINDPAGVSSDRAYLEKNLIALLATQGRQVDPPSPTWLGHHSMATRIKDSGLWNLQHLNADIDNSFLDVLEKYVSATVKAC